MFPLTMHKNAHALARVALIAKRQGNFKAVHRVFFEHQLEPIEKRMELAARALNVSRSWLGEHMTMTSNDLENEVRIAKALNVDGTPTSFLISPDGRVWAVHNPEVIASFISGNTRA
jgi:protein-disulfide isomerase